MCEESYTAKDKGVPLKARRGPEGSRRFRLPNFMTFGTWRWWGCHSHAPAAFTPRNVPVIFSRGWVDPRAMVQSEGSMSLKNPMTPPGIDPGTVRLVAQRLNHYATLGPVVHSSSLYYLDLKEYNLIICARFITYKVYIKKKLVRMHTTKSCVVSRGMASFICNLFTRYWWMVGFTPVVRWIEGRVGPRSLASAGNRTAISRSSSPYSSCYTDCPISTPFLRGVSA
jgi:hypothetical protein